MKKQLITRILFISCLVFFSSQRSYAAGYALLEQSTRGMGLAFAGDAAGFGDGSSVYFNPAAMGFIEGKTVFSLGAHIIAPSADFSNTGSSLNPLLGGGSLLGGNGGDGGEVGVVPNFYAVHRVNEELTLGFGVNSPFGLATEFSSGWVGRYQALKSELITINLNPSIAYEIFDGFTIGGGIRAIYADAELSNAIDFGSIGVSQLGLATASSLGLLPQAADGIGRVTGDDWGAGFTFGLGYEYAKGSRIGIAWRSKIHIEARGDADFTVPTAALPLTMTGAFTNTNASASVNLPEAVNFGWVHALDDSTSIHGGVEWTRWSRFNELRVKFGNGQPDSVVDEGWNNTWRYSLGISHRPCEDLELRAGWTFDETAIGDAEHRTPRIPGNSRNWLALGLGYQITEALRADVSYAHLFVQDGSSNTVDANGHTLTGNWDAHVDLVSLALQYNLG